INTGAACHLDAHMISHALGELQPSVHSIVMIENVGNLVCPSMFDLGEKSKVLIVSVTEGEDKPLKYPYMFQASELVILNKTDLLPYLDFDVDKFAACTHQVNPDAQILQVSATKGNGMEAWYEWVIQGTTGKFSRSVSM
ncbi:MAG: hydrogenase accessory protein HypB, partial [Armatimonadetes bacterium CG_4_8_14_3_um_filter_58_9]